MRCKSPMESCTFPIEYKNSPFDKSIESTKVYGPFYYGDIFLSLATEMQQSNRKLHFSDRIKEFSIWQTDRIDRIDKSLWGPTTTAIFFCLANEMQQSNGKLDVYKNSVVDKWIESIELLWPIFRWTLFDSIGQPSSTLLILKHNPAPFRL